MSSYLEDNFIFLKKPFGKKESLSVLQPYVKAWFEKNFEDLTPPQRFSLKLISEGKNVIITGPTGSGKTLAAFLSILSELFKLGEKGELLDSIYVVYISPLKALDNDIKKNLTIPLTEIRKLASESGINLPEIRISLRTGDVSSSEKQNQLKLPPHILITTPESLAVILNAPKFSIFLKTVKWVVVDEIHELASNKRGVHLSLSLERLQNLVSHEIVRIGLGATLFPLEEAAKFLVGYENNAPRKCYIVDVSWDKKYDLKLITPVKNLVYSSADELNDSLYNILDKAISKGKTTLIFTNTRSGTERVVFHLKEKWSNKYNDQNLGAHHGSLSRDIRLEVENKLKNGQMKAVVSSTSLELGIDVGFIDQVIQIGSPKSVSRAIQRVGRSGHGFKDVAKGIFIAMDRDELVELIVMLQEARSRNLDSIEVPKKPLDILAQHIVGMSLYKKWKVEEALSLIRSCYAYRDLTEDELISLLRYLAGEYVELEDRKVYGKIWFDPSDKTFGKRGKYTRVIYYLNIGAIPDEVKVDVYKLPGKKFIGGIEESFLERLRPNDIFVLGGKLYKFRYARAMKCYVEHAPKGSTPTIPSWFSEMLPLSFELALQIQKFRENLKNMLVNGKIKSEIIEWLKNSFSVSKDVANEVYSYFKEQYLYTKTIPGYMEILIEKTKDEKASYLVFHALFGRRVNDALSRFFSIIVSDELRKNIGIVISDTGFALIMPRSYNLNLQKLIEKSKSMDLESVLKDNVRRTELMKRRFRHCAARSFLVLRNYKGYKISVNKQQLSSQTILNIIENKDPNFPVLKETYREILQDVMDLKRAKLVLDWIKEGKLKIRIIETNIPSPFAHNLIILGEEDVVLMRDKKKRLLELHEKIMEKISALG
ncbi:MAG: ATP-dependent helicase [Thermoproteota archaeon]|nr:ATP-dependent helicase [Candidatus Brockarchaeota archaeon]